MHTKMIRMLMSKIVCWASLTHVHTLNTFHGHVCTIPCSPCLQYTSTFECSHAHNQVVHSLQCPPMHLPQHQHSQSRMHIVKAGPTVLIRLRMYTAHTYAYLMSGFCPYVRSLQAYETYEIATYGNIRQSWGKVAPRMFRRHQGAPRASTTMMRRLSAVIMTRYGHLKLTMTISTLVMTTLVTHESSYKDTHSRHTCLHPYTRCHAHTALSNVRVFGHDVNLSLDNICLFVHDVEPPCWFTVRACGCREGPC